MAESRYAAQYPTITIIGGAQGPETQGPGMASPMSSSYNSYRRVEDRTASASRARQDLILGNIETVMGEHGQEVDRMLREEHEAAQIALQREIEQPLQAWSYDEQDRFLTELQRERDEQESILEQLIGQTSKTQEAQLQMARERPMVEQAWGQHEAYLDKLRASRARQRAVAERIRARKAQPQAGPGVDLQALEKQWRDIRQREKLAGNLSADAAARKDKAAWERAGKILDKLFAEREQIREQIKKADPKHEERLYLELYR
jgi:hypothetical protein